MNTRTTPRKGERAPEYIQRLYEEGMHPDAAIEEGVKAFGDVKYEKDGPPPFGAVGAWEGWCGVHMTNVTMNMGTGMAFDKKGNILNTRGSKAIGIKKPNAE